MDILSTDTGRTQVVRTKSLQIADLLANFEQQMADYMEATGARIRAAREAKYRTRAKAQDETGISEKQWYRWEHGVTEPTADNWDRISEVLGVDLSSLRADPPKLLDPESELQAKLDRIEEKLDEVLKRLSPPGEAPASKKLRKDRPAPKPSRATQRPRKKAAGEN